MNALARISLLASAALAGCSSMAPAYVRPAAPVAATFPDAPSTTGTAAADLPWQQFFSDARLSRLIELALAQNRDLRVAVLNIEQARAQVDVRRADEWPTISAGLTGSRAPTGTGSVNTLVSAGVQVTAYELDLFGRVRSGSDAALAQYLATDEARKAVQISLVATLASTYLSLQADEEVLRVTRQTLATRDDSVRLTRLRFDNGASSQLDVRQAESLRAQAQVILAQTLRQRALDLNALTLLVGQPLPEDLPAAAPITALPEVPAGVSSDLLARRPDIRQAEQLLMAANANIGAARAAFYPRITLTGSAGTASSQLSGLFKAGSFGWSFAPQLLQPLFDSGRNEGNLKLAQVGRDIAVAQYEKSIQTAFREVADALAGRATLGEQLQAQQAQVAAEQDRVRLSELRYRNGAASYLDLLDAQRSLFAAQQALVQLQALRLQNSVALYRVLGGGWSAAPTSR